MSTGTNPIIVTKNLSKVVTSGDKPLTILQDINLTINTAESIAVVGVSGSGKTTLLGLLAGLDLPTSGELLIDNQDLTKLDEDGRAALRGRLIGFVFQTFQLLPSLTALENIMLPLELAGREDAKSKAQEWIQQVGLKDRASHYPHQLSGGEQQRVAIARAFVVKPKLLFADEPTGNLDKVNSQHIIDLLFELNRSHDATLVTVTHDDRLAKRCNREYQLDGGRLV